MGRARNGRNGAQRKKYFIEEKLLHDEEYYSQGIAKTTICPILKFETWGMMIVLPLLQELKKGIVPLLMRWARSVRLTIRRHPL